MARCVFLLSVLGARGCALLPMACHAWWGASFLSKVCT